ncbi:Gfo/Idh/MocA family oxidoreductase [Aquimarina gracilis]|uniref:Gfo/Idh/MocA family oxidoreductase n=1 Tax=Aquimarina gracilis TaxID=874422 RepID=A0ABU5ZRY0_9FLAO|nr:Gfo/Idh/MocA family oxidoreductase [Aquimarina gracilis]MEB3344788.1 Gfo/Idh/MocA family oxidoreductase [Aquimarina gracilis]
MEELKKIKWGIIGLGNIAHQFVKDLELISGAQLLAVGSRDINKAKNFAKMHKAKKFYGSYKEVMQDDDVDIIYIATPHDSHADLTVKSLQQGKHVLCEKPVALNYHEAKQMVEASGSNNRFFMEAFWTRFNPSIQEVLMKIRNNEIGEIKYVNADFAFNVGTPQKRMIDIENGAGSLMDMGVYPLFLSYLVLGKPEYVLASANFYDSGADQQTSMILQYSNAHAVLHSSFVAPSNMIATISGTEGRICLSPVWHETQSYSIIKNNHKVVYQFPTKGKGFTYEIEECHRCILNNEIESDLWSHKDSLNLIQIVDEVRKQIGLQFPSEKQLNQ